ncbi:MAG: phosphoribosylglycinamide formyltransferase [Actinomycetes bacterium]
MPVSAPARLVVLASGTGTLLQALLDAGSDQEFGARVVAVGADRDGAPALSRAKDTGLPTFVVPLANHEDRTAWNRALGDEIAAHLPDLVVQAGFMKILSADLLDRFAHRVLNTHPALLPAFPGAHAVRDALAYGVKVTGATVHLVDTGIDTGPVVAQAAVPVRDTDDEQTLHERIKTVERALLVDVVGQMARGGYEVEGRKVRLL